MHLTIRARRTPSGRRRADAWRLGPLAVAAMLLVSPRPPAALAQTITEVQVAPVAVTLRVGERRELLASAYDARGDNIATARFMWTSSNPGVVRVDDDPNIPGVVVLIGVAQGIASVEARAGNQKGSAAVQVTATGASGTPVPIGTGGATLLQIEPGSVFLLPSEGIQLTPVFLRDDGTPAAPAPVRWRSLRADVASVTPEGAVVGVSPGQGVVEATSSTGLLARVTVQVAQSEFAFGLERITLSPGQSDTIRTMVPDQNYRAISPRRLIWRSTNPQVVRVSPLGVLTALVQGRAEILATGFGQESRLPVVVHRRVDLLEVTPKASAGPVGVPLGGARAFTVKALAADDTPVPEAQLVWKLTDPGVATLDPSTGQVTGRALGHTELTVRAPGKGLEVTWGIDVVAGGLELETRWLTLGLGDAHRLRAWFLGDDGIRVSEAAGVNWFSSAPDVIEVDEQGTVRPVAFGEARVVATTPWGTTDSATIFVSGELLVSSTRSGNADLYTFDRDRPGAFHRLTDSPGAELSAVYSPDGTAIAYVSEMNGALDVYVADARGANPVQLTSGDAQEGSPTWTPDGRHILYESNAGGVIQVWIMDADGANKRQLTHGDSPNIQPAVSPDGRTVAFTSTRDGNYDVYLMDIDGSDQRYFTNTPSHETLPAWIGNDALVFITETRTRKSSSRVVTRMELGRQTTILTPEGLAVTDFAISPSGDLLAAVVSAEGPKGRPERRLYLIPTDGQAVPVEVPRATDTDQLITPSFRR